MPRFFRWLVEPLAEIIQPQKGEDLYFTSTPYIPPAVINTSTLSTIYRPKTFDEYIGQEEAKSNIISNLKGTQVRNKIFPHTLIYGPPGTGKTTLAQIIAHELNVPFKEIITSTLKNELALLMNIVSAKGGILFLDEIHGIPRELAETIYSIMEDFKFNGQPVSPFTLIGATTEMGELLADRRPFVERFEIQIELEDYQIKDLVTIVKQYKERIFPTDKMDESHYEIIASNCRANPRTAIRMLKGCIYLNDDIKILLLNNKIIKNGFTRKDLKVLKYIASNEKGVGLQGICSFLGTSQINVLQDLEPFLLRNSLIARTPKGRKITTQGLAKIEELQDYEKT